MGPSTRAGVGKSRTAARKRAAGRRGPKRRQSDLLQRADIVEFVSEQARQIAAPDVEELVAEAAKTRAKAAALDGSRFQALRQQVQDALECLDDYLAGSCPQIPYYTISVLAAGLFYFRRPVDALPDLLSELGALDDALVMAVATEMAEEGLTRYRTSKSLSD